MIQSEGFFLEGIRHRHSRAISKTSRCIMETNEWAPVIKGRCCNVIHQMFWQSIKHNHRHVCKLQVSIMLSYSTCSKRNRPSSQRSDRHPAVESCLVLFLNVNHALQNFKNQTPSKQKIPSRKLQSNNFHFWSM